MQNYKKTFSANITRYFISSFLLVLLFIVSGCGKEEGNTDEPPVPIPLTSITITHIHNIPAHVTFDKVMADITGTCWSIIGTVEANYENQQAVITLPSHFTTEQLQIVDRRDNNMCGYWPATSSEPTALVATLGDIIAYLGKQKVGRIYLSNWSGKASSAGKAFVYYQYADRIFTLTGSNNSYYYSDCSFKKGWNSFANINPLSEGVSGNIHCTTSIPDDLFWCFESWV